jgi:hypothetical protein
MRPLKEQGSVKKKPSTAAAIRASISFPPGVYQSLETIAKEKKVSLAWVVRDAAEHYIADKRPFGAAPEKHGV